MSDIKLALLGSPGAGKSGGCAGFFHKQQAAQTRAAFLSGAAPGCRQPSHQQAPQPLKSSLFSRRRLETSKHPDPLMSGGSSSITVPSFCRTRFFLIKGILCDQHECEGRSRALAVTGAPLPPPPPAGGWMSAVTHALLLPPSGPGAVPDQALHR